MNPDIFTTTPTYLPTLPLFGSKVAAGFPSPCDSHQLKRLNIHEYLVDQEESTFIVSVCSSSLRDIGILPEDKVVVNKAADAKIGSVILAVVNGEFTLKILAVGKNGSPLLNPANPEFEPIEIKAGMDFEIWGVVTGSFRKF
jgi:DNA polymerase V